MASEDILAPAQTFGVIHKHWAFKAEPCFYSNVATTVKHPACNVVDQNGIKPLVQALPQGLLTHSKQVNTVLHLH